MSNLFFHNYGRSIYLRRLKDMQVTLVKQHELLRLIVQKMEIQSEADNQDEGVMPDYQRHFGGSNVSGEVRNKLLAANAFKSLTK